MILTRRLLRSRVAALSKTLSQFGLKDEIWIDAWEPHAQDAVFAFVFAEFAFVFAEFGLLCLPWLIGYVTQA